MELFEARPSIEFELKDISSESRTIVQAFAKYGVPDDHKDVSREGMFAKTWSENKHRIKHLLNHDPLKPVGKPENVWDEKGFAVMKSKIGTHKLGDDFLEMALSGLITEASYGGPGPTRFNRLKGGGREIIETKMFEISSLTHWGAQEFTPLLSVKKDMNSEDFVQKCIKRSDALEKFCRNTTASDETIETLLLEYKQLSQIIIDFSKNATYAAAEAAPTPVTELSETIKSFTNSLTN